MGPLSPGPVGIPNLAGKPRRGQRGAPGGTGGRVPATPRVLQPRVRVGSGREPRRFLGHGKCPGHRGEGTGVLPAVPAGGMGCGERRRVPELSINASSRQTAAQLAVSLMAASPSVAPGGQAVFILLQPSSNGTDRGWLWGPSSPPAPRDRG